jgi:hypothetical protein
MLRITIYTGHCGPKGYSICVTIRRSYLLVLQLVLNDTSFLHYKEMPSEYPSMLVTKSINFLRVDQIKTHCPRQRIQRTRYDVQIGQRL